MAHWASWALAGLLCVSLALGNVFSAILLLLCVPSIVVGLRQRSCPQLKWPAIGFGVLWLAHLLAIALSPTPHWSKLVEEFWLKLLIFAIPFVASPASSRRAIAVFAWVGLGVALFSATQHFHGIDPWRGGKVNRFGEYYQSVGFFGHHLSYAGHLLVLSCLVLARAMTIARRRAWWLVGLAICLVTMQWSVARSAQLGMLGAVAAIALHAGRRVRLATAAVLLLTIVAVIATPNLRGRWTKLTQEGDESTRVLLWKSSFDGIKAKPLGFGSGNFQAMLDEYGHEGRYESRAHAHNDYLMYGVNAGVLGIAGYLLFWGSCGVVLWRRGRHGDPLALAGLACVAAFAVAGLFQVYQTDDEVELAMFFLLGHAMATVSWQASPPAKSERSDAAADVAADPRR